MLMCRDFCRRLFFILFIFFLLRVSQAHNKAMRQNDIFEYRHTLQILYGCFSLNFSILLDTIYLPRDWPQRWSGFFILIINFKTKYILTWHINQTGLRYILSVCTYCRRSRRRICVNKSLIKISLFPAPTRKKLKLNELI